MGPYRQNGVIAERCTAHNALLARLGYFLESRPHSGEGVIKGDGEGSSTAWSRYGIMKNAFRSLSIAPLRRAQSAQIILISV